MLSNKIVTWNSQNIIIQKWNCERKLSTVIEKERAVKKKGRERQSESERTLSKINSGKWTEFNRGNKMFKVN